MCVETSPQQHTPHTSQPCDAMRISSLVFSPHLYYNQSLTAFASHTAGHTLAKLSLNRHCHTSVTPQKCDANHLSGTSVTLKLLGLSASGASILLLLDNSSISCCSGVVRGRQAARKQRRGWWCGGEVAAGKCHRISTCCRGVKARAEEVCYSTTQAHAAVQPDSLHAHRKLYS